MRLRVFLEFREVISEGDNIFQGRWRRCQGPPYAYETVINCSPQRFGELVIAARFVRRETRLWILMHNFLPRPYQSNLSTICSNICRSNESRLEDNRADIILPTDRLAAKGGC